MHLVLQILTAAQALEKRAAKLFKPHGLTAAQFNVLHVLSEHPEGMRASDLAGVLIVDPSNVTGLLKRMKSAGWVASVENPADRRQHVVMATRRGQAVWKAALRDYEAELAAIYAELPAAQAKTAEKILGQIIGLFSESN